MACFARHDDIDVVSAAQAMVEHRQEAVGVWRQINANDVRHKLRMRRCVAHRRHEWSDFQLANRLKPLRVHFAHRQIFP